MLDALSLAPESSSLSIIKKVGRGCKIMAGLGVLLIWVSVVVLGTRGAMGELVLVEAVLPSWIMGPWPIAWRTVVHWRSGCIELEV